MNDAHAHVQTAAWRARRAKYMSGKTHCGICFRPKHGQMHVHHLHYRNLGHEADADLMMVCKKCHEAIHEIATLEKLAAADATARLKRLVLLWGPKVATAKRIREHHNKAAA